MLNTKGVAHSSSVLTQPKSILKTSKYTPNGVGFNPNDTVESEYIDNLLKQVHFMNLEIKLLKEKGEETKGKMGISGFLQQDGKQLVDHVIISKDKYHQMKNDLNNQLVDNNDHLQDLLHQFSVEDNRKNYLESQMTTLKDNIKTEDDDFQAKIKEFLQKGQKEKENKERLESSIVQAERQIKDIQREYDQSLQTEQENLAYKALQNQAEQEDAALETALHSEDLKAIQLLEEQVAQAQDRKSRNEEFQRLLQEHGQVKKQRVAVEIELLHKQYEVREQEQLINYSTREKEAVLGLKEQLKKELDGLKDVLAEIEKINQLKVNKKLNLIDNQKSRDLKKQLLQLQRELEQQKQKCKNLEKDARLAIKQSIEKKKVVQDLQDKNNGYTQGMQTHHATLNAHQPHLLSLDQVIAQNRQQHEQIKQKHKDLLRQLNALQEQQVDYDSSVAFLRQHVHMDEDLKHINLDELKNLQRQNSGVNSTIDGFINKWGDITQFSRL